MLREFNFLRKLGKSTTRTTVTSAVTRLSFSSSTDMLTNQSFIGEGSFGAVYLVRRISDNQLYALKKVSFWKQRITEIWGWRNKLIRKLKSWNFFNVEFELTYSHLFLFTGQIDWFARKRQGERTQWNQTPCISQVSVHPSLRLGIKAHLLSNSGPSKPKCNQGLAISSLILNGSQT